MSKQCLTCQHENSDTAVVCEACNAPFEPSAPSNQQGVVDQEIFIFARGDLIAGRYLVVEEISRSGLELAYRVKDANFSDQEYILKMLHPDFSSDPEARKRFEDEVAVCMDLIHPPKVHFDRFKSGQDIYYYLTGPSLEDYQLERKGTVPPFTLAEIQTVMKSLLDTLYYAHQFTIHNHISPETIIVMGTFPDVSIRLLDFGVAGALLAARLTGAGADTRSLVYMAPEQVSNPLASDLRADLFSVGMILYEMLTNEKAVGIFKMPSEIFSDHYKPLDKVLKKVLSSKVDQRHSSALELSADISSALAEVSKAPTTSSPTQELRHIESSIDNSPEEKEEDPITRSKEKARTIKHAYREIQKARTINTEKEQAENQNKRTKKLLKTAVLPHGSRLFLIVCLALLLCLAGGGYVLVNKKSINEDKPEILNSASRPELFVSIEPTDPRKASLKVGVPTEKQTGKLTVITNPSDARIELLNGPAYKDGMQLRSGTYRIKVSKKGFISQEYKAAISSGREEKIRINLSPVIRTGHLTVLPSPADAVIRILNIKPTYQPNLELRPGHYQVEVSAPGYQTLTRWIDLSADEDLQVEMALEKEETKNDGRVITELRPSREVKKNAPEVAGMEMALIQGGCYTMGQSPEEKRQLIKLRGEKKYDKAYSDEIPPHKVCVDSFYMSKYEVTVGQWNTFVQETGYRTDAEKNSGGKNGCNSLSHGGWSQVKGRSWKNTGFPQSVQHPVACVSFNDVTAYIDWLNKKNGRLFRLPTEAEWEYAARGRTSMSRYWGDEINKKACQYANVASYQKNKTNFFPCNDGYTWSSPVGSFQPNQYGLYDMLGNVWEWCSDIYDIRYYSTSPLHNPRGPSSGGKWHVVRGGSWNGRPSGIRAANRNWRMPNGRKSNLGFRLVALPATGG